jgi:hypothetical protein
MTWHRGRRWPLLAALAVALAVPALGTQLTTGHGSSRPAVMNLHPVSGHEVVLPSPSELDHGAAGIAGPRHAILPAALAALAVGFLVRSRLRREAVPARATRRQGPRLRAPPPAV